MPMQALLPSSLRLYGVLKEALEDHSFLPSGGELAFGRVPWP